MSPRIPSFVSWTQLRPAIQLAICSIALTAVCVSSFTVGALKLLVPPLNIRAPSAASNRADISFAVEMISADPVSRTFTMDWYPSTAIGCSTTPKVADIFFVPGYLDASSPSFSPLPPINPVYRFNSSSFCEVDDNIGAVFRTVSRLLAPPAFSSTSGQSSLQSYPFDAYFVKYGLYAADLNTGARLPVNITGSLGIVVNFEVGMDSSFYDDTVGQLFISLRIKRSTAMKLFVIFIAMTNWLIAAVFLVISSAVMIYPSHEIYAEMFVLPVGALFAFTSVRANLPGAPAGFGAAIDLFTILPVLVILALSSAFLLLVVLYRRINKLSLQGQVFEYAVPKLHYGSPRRTDSDMTDDCEALKQVLPPLVTERRPSYESRRPSFQHSLRLNLQAEGPEGAVEKQQKWLDIEPSD